MLSRRAFLNRSLRGSSLIALGTRSPAFWSPRRGRLGQIAMVACWSSSSSTEGMTGSTWSSRSLILAMPGIGACSACRRTI